MLQCVAVCCSVLQGVAGCCSVVHSNRLASTNILSFTCLLFRSSSLSFVHQYVLQCVAVCCSVLQHVAACYSAFQCSILPFFRPLFLSTSLSIDLSLFHPLSHTFCPSLSLTHYLFSHAISSTPHYVLSLFLPLPRIHGPSCSLTHNTLSHTTHTTSST